MKIEIYNGRITRLTSQGRNSGTILEIEATIHGLTPTVIVDGQHITGPVNGQPEGRMRPSSEPA